MVHLYAALLQIPGMDRAELTTQEQLSQAWDGMGIMRWPLIFCLGLGIIVIIIKFISLTIIASKSKKLLKEVDELLVQRQIKENSGFHPHQFLLWVAPLWFLAVGGHPSSHRWIGHLGW